MTRVHVNTQTAILCQIVLTFWCALDPFITLIDGRVLIKTFAERSVTTYIVHLYLCQVDSTTYFHMTSNRKIDIK